MEKEKYEAWKNANSDIIEEIRQAAWALHDSVNQTYDGNKPYGIHLDMVANSVQKFAHIVCDEECELTPLFFGAFFHDSIEDARLTYNDVKKIAQKWMTSEQAHMAAEIVFALTNDKGRTRSERAGERYYSGIRATPYAPFVKLADRWANISYSCGSEGVVNQHMREIYQQELPHFIQSIEVNSTDKRFSLPLEMKNSIFELLQKQCKDDCS